jgi:thiamine kinase-like enzyme
LHQDIDMQWITSLCIHYNIGEPLGQPSPVTGGLLHRMWKLSTTEGQFALKILNPEIMSRAGVLSNYLLSERIAVAAASSGIPAVLAKTVNNDILTQVSGVNVMLFDWIEGAVLAPADCRAEHASRIGTLLHKIHHMKFEEQHSALWTSFEQEHLRVLTDEGLKTGMPWAQQVDTGFNDLLEWNEHYKRASIILNQNQCFSHRDLGPKNVVWKAGLHPYIIDWEAAGSTNPIMELLDAALSWSGIDSGKVNKETFITMISSYQKAGGTALIHVKEAFYGRMGSMLEWLEYNMRRSLRKDIFGESEQQLGNEQVLLTFSSLKEMSDNIEVWMEWIEEREKNETNNN